MEKEALVKENERLGIRMAKMEQYWYRFDGQAAATTYDGKKVQLKPFDVDSHFMDEVYRNKYSEQLHKDSQEISKVTI